MQSIYNRYHCCTPDKERELGMDKVQDLVNQILSSADANGHDYNHVAYEMISMITTIVAGMHIRHGIATHKSERDG